MKARKRNIISFAICALFVAGLLAGSCYIKEGKQNAVSGYAGTEQGDIIWEYDTVSGDEKTVKKVLELLTLQKKMETAMTADVDTNVSDEEAAQRTFSYMKINLTTYTDESGKQQTYSADETTVVKKNADDAAQKAQSDFDGTAQEYSYDVKTYSYGSDEC